jgi:hypothetical protein
MVNSLSGAPQEYQNVAQSLLTGLNADQIWKAFLAKESLTIDPTATQDAQYLQAFITYAQQQATIFTNAPTAFQNAATNLIGNISSLSSTQLQTIWSAFLAQENLQTNPLETDVATYTDFTNFLITHFTQPTQMLLPNAPNTFQAALQADPSLQDQSALQQKVWAEFLVQEGLSQNPQPTDPNYATISNDFSNFLINQNVAGNFANQLILAPTAFQNIANAYLGGLSPSQQQSIWQQFLQVEPNQSGQNPAINNPNLAALLNDFTAFVQQASIQSIELGASNALSPNEVQQRQLVLSVFQVMLLMLSTLQNTQQVQTTLDVFYGKQVDVYTQMMAKVPIYLGGDNENAPTVNLTDLSKFNLGYDNIDVQDILNYTLESAQGFNLVAKNSIIPIQQANFFTFQPVTVTATPGGGTVPTAPTQYQNYLSTDPNTVLSAFQNLIPNYSSLSSAEQTIISSMATAIAQSNDPNNSSNFGTISSLAQDPTVLSQNLINLYVAKGGGDSTTETALTTLATTLAPQNAQYTGAAVLQALNNPNAVAASSGDFTSVYNALVQLISLSGNVINQGQQSGLQHVANIIATSINPQYLSLSTPVTPPVGNSTQNYGTEFLTSTSSQFLQQALTGLYGDIGVNLPSIRDLLVGSANTLSQLNTQNPTLLHSTISTSGYTVSFLSGPANSGTASFDAFTSPPPTIATVTVNYPTGATQQQQLAAASQAFVNLYNNPAVQNIIGPAVPLSLDPFGLNSGNAPVSIPWRYITESTQTYSLDSSDSSTIINGAVSARNAKDQEIQQLIESLTAQRQTITNQQTAVQDNLSNDANLTNSGAGILETTIQTLQSILSAIFQQSTSSG